MLFISSCNDSIVEEKDTKSEMVTSTRRSPCGFEGSNCQVFEVVEPSWAAGDDFYTQLDNGDWLIKFITGCWDDGVFNSLFHEVWRVSESDFTLMVGVPNVSGVNDELIVLPNPVLDYIRLELDQSTISSVFIYDIQGRLVHRVKEKQLNGLDIEVSHFSKGMYILRVIDANKNVQHGRFLKI